LDKVKAVRERSAVPIEVDGGIDAATIRDAYISGATVFVAGSFLASATDQRSAMEAMRAACVD
jgi:pentose-5-phosphate-3-epimerase